MALKVGRIWDNGGHTFDRYSVEVRGMPAKPKYVAMLALSSNPTSPQGFSQWTEGMPGPHLGKRIRMDDLPDHIQEHIRARLAE